jgi:hypothetical protein
MAGLLDDVVNNIELVESIANEVGIKTSDAGSVITHLAPILMGAAKYNFQSSRDSGDLLKQIQDSQFSNMIDAPKKAVEKGGLIDLGNIILKELTGSKENSGKVAKHVQNETGISDLIIKKILPMIAPFIIGALGKKAAPTINQHQQNNAGVTGGLENILIGMIDKDHDGSIIDDVAGMVMKRLFA